MTPQRCWDGEKGEHLRATTNAGLSRQSPHARCRIVCPLSFVVRPFMPSTFTTALFLAWRTGETGEQLLFSPASPVLPAEFHTGFSMVFRRKERKVRKEMENQRLLTPIIFPEKPLLLV